MESLLKGSTGTAFYFLIAFLTGIFVLCEAEFLTLGKFSSGNEASAKVCLMRLGIPELSSLDKEIFPEINIDKALWNAKSHERLNSSVELSYSPIRDMTCFFLDGHWYTVEEPGAAVHPNSRITMVTRGNLRDAVRAFGFKTFSERISKSRRYLGNFSFSRTSREIWTDYKEKIGFIMRSGFSTWHEEYSKGGFRTLETCQTNYVETELSYTGNLSNEGFSVTEHRVNIIFNGFNSTSDLYKGKIFSEGTGQRKGYLFQYTGFWRSSDWDDFESQRKTFLTYRAAKDLHLHAPLEVARVGLYLTSFTRGFAGLNTTILLWNGNRSRNYEERSHTVRVKGTKFKMTSGPADIEIGNRLRSALRMRKDSLRDRVSDSATQRALKALEKDMSPLDANNDTVELVLASTALLTALITVVCLGTSRLKIMLGICLEVIDLVIGAIPGFMVLWKGLFRGNFRIGPAAFVTRSIPGEFMERRKIRQKSDGKPVHAVYLPVFVTECTAVAFRKSPDTMWFIVAYSIGISVGIFILIFQLWYYHLVRRRRKASTNFMEDPELPALAESRNQKQLKPCIRSLLILRRSYRRLKRVRSLRKARNAHDITTKLCID